MVPSLSTEHSFLKHLVQFNRSLIFKCQRDFHFSPENQRFKNEMIDFAHMTHKVVMNAPADILHLFHLYPYVLCGPLTAEAASLLLCVHMDLTSAPSTDISLALGRSPSLFNLILLCVSQLTRLTACFWPEESFLSFISYHCM